jgi:hypothetical protein
MKQPKEVNLRISIISKSHADSAVSGYIFDVMV